MSAAAIPGDAKSRMERILRLQEQVDAIKADIREVYAEEKAAGGDKTAMGAAISYIRKREKDGTALAEREAMADVYVAAFDAPRAHTHTREARSYAEAKGPEPVQETHKFDPETGEIIETQESSDGMASGSDHLSADHVSPPASQAEMGGGSANKEQGYVDGSAARAGYGGQSLPLAGQIESRTKANFVDGTASLAAREGEQAAAPFPHSTVAAPPAIVEQPEAPNTSPATSGTNLTRPAFPAVPGDEPGIPSSAADGAKTDGAEPAHPGRADLASDHRSVKAEQVATKHQPKPHCLEPASCKLGFTTALCWKCNDARMKARAEA